MVSNLIASKNLSCTDSIALLQKLKQIAPDIWEGRDRCFILPQNLGGLEEPKYIEYLQFVIERLNEYGSMLDMELIGEAEYESKKAQLLYDFEIEAIR